MHSIFKLNSQLSTANKIAIYGAGKSGRNLKTKLNHMGSDIHVFIDSDYLKLGMVCDGKIIYGINWLKENHAACIIPSGYQEEIYLDCKKNKIENIFLDFRDGCEVALSEETKTQSLFVPIEDLIDKKTYILGTGKYSRRLFILLSSISDSLYIEGFLKFSLDKKYIGKSIYNHKIFCHNEISDKNIAILVPKSISELTEYENLNEYCYFENLF